MIYHFTSAKLLEKIIASGKLLPSNALGWRLLWATSAETIDLTASYAHEPVIARFTLHTCDFERWADVRERYQQKEMREEAERIEQSVLKHGRADPQDWYVRYAPLPSDRWLRIDTRSQLWQPYTSTTWRQSGPPQLAKLPWFSEEQYEQWGIDLGKDPATMDDDGLADYRYQTMDDDALADLRYHYQND